MHILLLIFLLEIRKSCNGRNIRSDDQVSRNFQLLPSSFQLPVDFHNIPRQGFGDIDFKQPLDILGYSVPKTRGHKEKIYDQTTFRNPRDEMLYYRKLYDIEIMGRDGKNNTDRTRERQIVEAGIPESFDFAAALERNLNFPHLVPHFQRPIWNRSDVERPSRVGIGKENFEDNSFILKPRQSKRKLNWTTCDEFAKGALFHPNDIVNTNWIPFYIWSTQKIETSVIHRFSYPSQQLVERFKQTFSRFTPKLDWSQPKMFLKEFQEILLIAGDRRGLFYGIIDAKLPDSVNRTDFIYPHLVMRLKIIDPYLAIMYCNERKAKIMAELGTEPPTRKQKISEATKLKFRGTGSPVNRDIAKEIFMENFKAQMKQKEEARKYITVRGGRPYFPPMK